MERRRVKLPVMTIEFYLITTKNWGKKRKQLIELLRDTPKRQFVLNNALSKFHTDRSDHQYREKFCEIFKEELDEIKKEVECDLEVNDVWSVLYNSGDFHPPHNHADANFSAVLYFDYNFLEHTGTSVILNSVNPKTNMTDIVTPEVIEGQILVFPSQYLHFTAPHYSNQPRGIMAFDMKVKNWK